MELLMASGALAPSQVLTDFRPPARVNADSTVGTLYLDNEIFLSQSRECVDSARNSAADTLRAAGLPVHEEAEATTFLIGLGLQFDGQNLRVRISSERRWKLRQALKALCKRRTASPRQLQMILGHISFAFLLRRPLLSILVHSFRFAYLEQEFRPRSLWMSVKKELEVASSLLTLAFADLDLQTSVRVGVSDASKRRKGCS